MRILYFLLFFIPLIGLVTSNNIECTFEYFDSPLYDRAYYCTVENKLNITTRDNTTIESVTGTHDNGKSNDDVQGFYTSGKIIQYFPQGLEKFFKNLRLIIIYSSELKEIHQSDLKPFPELVYLDLGDNSIEVLEEGLFDYNLQLQHIGIYVNKLKKIHHTVFDNLSHLRTLGLIFNDCIHKYAQNDTVEVKEVIRKVKVLC